ncbi:L-rhamnose mutarotase [uncultured Alsobacter sp.]|uniref:L-rhamnose mutarotase n=1 Tax=uncultured Alsobacter sp. TaxID=1748258 RepID=UPI0025D70CCC|nr:L-rhamnose mutarotase [uncultured Alsobacter sp.]
MQRHAFKMQLDPGRRDEYRRRHDEIWPELVHLLRQAGISNYSIWLDEETHVLFGYLERRDDHGMDALPDHPVMKRWWQHMKDVMRTNPDGSPVAEPLLPVFYLA